VLSPSEHTPAVERKIAAYLRGGVEVVWVVDGRRRTVTIHRRDVEPLVIPDDGELDGGEVVPGFRLPISEIFA
jgi:Uma2 family endonuclease